MPRVTLEFYGIPRARAGRAAVAVEAGTLGGALVEAGRLVPDFATGCLNQGKLRPEFLANCNGQMFTSNMDLPLTEGDAILILSADVGG